MKGEISSNRWIISGIVLIILLVTTLRVTTCTPSADTYDKARLLLVQDSLFESGKKIGIDSIQRLNDSLLINEEKNKQNIVAIDSIVEGNVQKIINAPDSEQLFIQLELCSRLDSINNEINKRKARNGFWLGKSTTGGR